MIGAKENLSIGEVAQLTGVSQKTVLGAVQRGELAAYRFNARVVVVPRAAVQAWLDQCSRMARLKVHREMNACGRNSKGGANGKAGTGTSSVKQNKSA